MASTPTVFVVDDDRAVRDSIQWLVESIGVDVETFDSPKRFLETCKPDRPGCLLLDVRMPDMSGVQLQEILRKRGFTLPVIVITGYGEVTTAVRAMKQGAVDFVEKPFNDQALVELIQKCIERDAVDRETFAQRAQIRGRLALLTPREREVMDRVVAGKSNKEIAKQLDISLKTVEVHRSRVMQKMQAHSLAELVQMFMLDGNEGKP